MVIKIEKRKRLPTGQLSSGKSWGTYTFPYNSIRRQGHWVRCQIAPLSEKAATTDQPFSKLPEISHEWGTSDIPENSCLLLLKVRPRTDRAAFFGFSWRDKGLTPAHCLTPQGPGTSPCTTNPATRTTRIMTISTSACIQSLCPEDNTVLEKCNFKLTRQSLQFYTPPPLPSHFPTGV